MPRRFPLRDAAAAIVMRDTHMIADAFSFSVFRLISLRSPPADFLRPPCHYHLLML